MQLSHETYRTRWLVLVPVWLLTAVVLSIQTAVIGNYLDIVGQLGKREGVIPPTPLRAAYPGFAADAQTWIRHSLSLVETGTIQLRYTMIDNAPFGREVHWNSGWAWAIGLGGWVWHLFTGQPPPYCIERASLWLPTITLFLIAVFMSAWVTKRMGLAAGLVVLAALVCKDRVFEGFFPAYVDHHGLLTVAAFGVLLGVMVMGGGWWVDENKSRFSILPEAEARCREGAILSGLMGAFGLWVSAASSIPPIAIVGTAGLAAVLVMGRTATAQGARFCAYSWRLWGRVGAIASAIFYLVEYFPFHLGLRLEANHPLYALAWLGASELIAQISERWLGPKEERWKKPLRFAWPLAAVSLVPLTIIIGGAKVFIVLDPFLAQLHRDYIQEFLPMWKTVRLLDGEAIFRMLFWEYVPFVAAIATISYKRREASIVLWFTTIAAILFAVMAWWQSRWLLNSAGAQICLTLVVVADWTLGARPLIRWGAAVAAASILFIPTGVSRFRSAREEVAARRVAPRDAVSMLYRDVAAALRSSQPEGEMTVLSSPNGSTAIGYYGRFKTLGTLYWENCDGLKAAAGILGAKDDREAATLIRKHRVTHIAIVSEENFIAQYCQLIRPKATADEIRNCFGHQLFIDKKIPQWLRMIPYRVPDDLASLNISVLLFKVDFTQSVAEAIYNVALAQIASGAVVDAERNLDLLIKQVPHNYQPWIRKGELLIARHAWPEAADCLIEGITRAPEVQREGLYLSAAGSFYRQQQHALAIKIYRAALAGRFSPQAACYLAWILSTSKDDSIRNGAEAVELARQAVKLNGNSPTFLNTLAAALAETGQMAEAAAAADRALANARIQGTPTDVQVSEQRLATIRSGKPIRE